ncbi:MAG: hypothetical protein LCH30_01320 [Proteobacteria bacterium]|nr:hypothetical protein [Pseudomonadota bacterium]
MRKTTEQETKDAIEKQYAKMKQNANDILNEGKEKLAETQETVNNYTDELAKKIQTKPLTSVLIAGGIGFILSAIFKK